MSAEGCPAIISHVGGWGSHRCAKPIKRDGLCGVHAAAKDKRERNDAERAEKERSREALAVQIHELLGIELGAVYEEYGRDRFMADPHALIDALRSLRGDA